MLYKPERLSTNNGVRGAMPRKGGTWCATLFFVACVVVGQEPADVGSGLERDCPSIVFPPAGYSLGEHDPSHATVSVPAGCAIAEGGERAKLSVNGDLVEEWAVEAGSELTEVALLSRLRWGNNTVELVLSPAGGGAGRSSERRASATFEVTGAFLTTTFCEHVLEWDGDDAEGSARDTWPWELDRRPFLRRHAQVCIRRPTVTVTWPPEGYLFKKLGGGAGRASFSPFVRVNAEPLGLTCSARPAPAPGAAPEPTPPLPPRPVPPTRPATVPTRTPPRPCIDRALIFMAYRSGSALGLSIDRGPMHLYGQAYFVGLALPDGPHTLSVILATPDGAAATRPLSPPPLLPRPPIARPARSRRQVGPRNEPPHPPRAQEHTSSPPRLSSTSPSTPRPSTRKTEQGQAVTPPRPRRCPPRLQPARAQDADLLRFPLPF
jgi:hypothetical protein